MHAVAPERLTQAIKRSQAYILSQQHSKGYWIGELEANTTLTAEYVMFGHLVGRVDDIRQAKCIAYLLSEQLPDGGWALYYGGPSDLSTTVEAILPCGWRDGLPMRLPCNELASAFMRWAG